MQEYRNAGLIVRFNSKLCEHSGKCVKGLPQVFDIKARPWINVDGAAREQIVHQVQKCPSGALRYEVIEPEE